MGILRSAGTAPVLHRGVPGQPLPRTAFLWVYGAEALTKRRAGSYTGRRCQKTRLRPSAVQQPTPDTEWKARSRAN